MEQTIQNLKQILAKSSSLGNAVLDFKDDVAIVEQGVDSLDMLDFYLNVEEAFGVEIPDTEVGSLKTFENVLDYVKAKSE